MRFNEVKDLRKGITEMKLKGLLVPELMKLLDLKEELEAIVARVDKLQISIAEKYSLTLGEKGYSFTNHPEAVKIVADLEELEIGPYTLNSVNFISFDKIASNIEDSNIDTLAILRKYLVSK